MQLSPWPGEGVTSKQTEGKTKPGRLRPQASCSRGRWGVCEETGWHWTLGPGWGPGLPQGRPVHSAPGPQVAPEQGGVETRGTSLPPTPPVEPGWAWVSMCRLLCWLLVKERLVPGAPSLAHIPGGRKALWLLEGGVSRWIAPHGGRVGGA